MTYIEEDIGIPAAVDCERTILGAILLDNEAFFDEIVDLNSDDFSLNAHGKIYSVMNDMLSGLVEGAKRVDIVTLANELNNRKWLESVNGVSYLASLTEGLPRRPVIDQYILILKDKAKLRRLMRIFSSGSNAAQDQSEPAVEISARVQEQLVAEDAASGMSKSVSIGSVTPFVEASVNKNRVISDERKALDMTWGLLGLDEHTRGVFGGEFTVMSGESSGGKSSMGTQLTLANAREGIPCAWFSLEMTKEQVVRRYYAAMSTIITANHMRDPRLMNLHTHVPEMRRISEELSKLPIHIDDTSPMRIDTLRARIRMMRRKLGVRLFIVDYLQLIKGMPKMPRLDAFEHIVFSLRDIPKDEPDIHLMVLSQYSQGDKFIKGNKRTKDSLYGGSVIHHAAQNVIMITIEDPDKRDPLDLLDAEFRIAKQRDGKRGKVTCQFDRDHLTFCYAQRQL